jgi:hypothetical protein
VPGGRANAASAGEWLPLLWSCQAGKGAGFRVQSRIEMIIKNQKAKYFVFNLIHTDPSSEIFCHGGSFQLNPLRRFCNLDRHSCLPHPELEPQSNHPNKPTVSNDLPSSCKISNDPTACVVLPYGEDHTGQVLCSFFFTVASISL